MDEQDLFDKRREHHVKNRRKFWTMRYNPKTETYFKEQWSDRTVAQFEWSNSGWFRMTANQWWTSSYWLTVRYPHLLNLKRNNLNLFRTAWPSFLEQSSSHGGTCDGISITQQQVTFNRHWLICCNCIFCF